MKKIICAFFLMMAFGIVKAQTDTLEIKAAIGHCADSMSDAFRARNWKALAHFTLPSVIAMTGGEEEFAKLVESFMKDIPDTSVRQFSIGPLLQLVQADSGWQCVIEQHMEIYLNGMSIPSVTVLVGQSNENGRQWAFFDTKGNRQTAEMFLPSLSPKLAITRPAQKFVSNPPVKKIKVPAKSTGKKYSKPKAKQ